MTKLDRGNADRAMQRPSGFAACIQVSTSASQLAPVRASRSGCLPYRMVHDPHATGSERRPPLLVPGGWRRCDTSASAAWVMACTHALLRCPVLHAHGHPCYAMPSMCGWKAVSKGVMFVPKRSVLTSWEGAQASCLSRCSYIPPGMTGIPAALQLDMGISTLTRTCLRHTIVGSYSLTDNPVFGRSKRFWNVQGFKNITWPQLQNTGKASPCTSASTGRSPEPRYYST